MIIRDLDQHKRLEEAVDAAALKLTAEYMDGEKFPSMQHIKEIIWKAIRES